MTITVTFVVSCVSMLIAYIILLYNLYNLWSLNEYAKRLRKFLESSAFVFIAIVIFSSSVFALSLLSFKISDKINGGQIGRSYNTHGDPAVGSRVHGH